MAIHKSISGEETRRRVAEGIGRVYAETMGIAPEGVDVCFGREHLSALLHGCTSPAEEALRGDKCGAELMREYYEACAQEMAPQLETLFQNTLATGVRRVWLISESATRHRILVAALGSENLRSAGKAGELNQQGG